MRRETKLTPAFDDEITLLDVLGVIGLSLEQIHFRVRRAAQLDWLTD